MADLYASTPKPLNTPVFEYYTGHKLAEALTEEWLTKNGISLISTIPCTGPYGSA